MFTVRNTLAGAILSAAGVVVGFFVVPPNATLPAWAAMMHVWFLIAHLRLKDRVRQGKPGVWPAPSN